MSYKITVDFKKGGRKSLPTIAPYPKEVNWDNSVPVYKTAAGVAYVRTPDECFENLPDYPFAPNYLEIDGLRMHYLDEGPKDGQVVLLLHGQPAWSYLYRKMIKGLTENGYRCIAPDMIGMGKSDKPIKEAYHFYDKHTSNALYLIRALGLKDLTMFGQDWGSLIGSRLVGENSDLFARMILANGELPLFTDETNPFYLPDPVEIDLNIEDFETATSAYSMLKMPEWFQVWILYCMTNPHLFVGPCMQSFTEIELAAEEVAAYAAPFPSFNYMTGPRTLPSMFLGIRGQTRKAWENLKKFEKPFLSLIGLKDDLLGLPVVQNKWINKVPGAKGQHHEQFDNAGHFIQEDIGEIMADRVHQFIVKNPF